MNLQELNKEELKEIEGGIIPLAVAWGICKIVAVAAAGAYGVGYAIGTAHGHYSNNNKK